MSFGAHWLRRKLTIAAVKVGWDLLNSHAIEEGLTNIVVLFGDNWPGCSTMLCVSKGFFETLNRRDLESWHGPWGKDA